MATLKQIAAPVPPQLEEALGYAGEAEWVSFYWDQAGDTALCDDGRHVLIAAADAFLLYTRHRALAPYLKGYDLGSPEAPARHRLVLHRPDRALYVASPRVARAQVRAQWPQAAPTQEEVQQTLLGFRRLLQDEAAQSPEEARAAHNARLTGHQRALRELGAWLDGHQQVRMLSAVTDDRSTAAAP